MKVVDLKLPTRTVKALIHVGIVEVEQLTAMDFNELIRIGGIGAVGYKAIARRLRRHRLRLKGEAVPISQRQTPELSWGNVEQGVSLAGVTIKASAMIGLPRAVVESAVYFLFDGADLVYVGQAVNAMERIRAHRGDKDFDRMMIFPVPRSN